jgi:hypothetical protein
VRVRISDAGSGVVHRSLRVSFGDGSSVRGRTRISHHYSRGGVFEIVVRARDRLGNHAVVRQLVGIR